MLAAPAEVKIFDNVALQRFDFESAGVDGWTTVEGTWAVEEMDGAPSGRKVLVQRATGNAFNVIVASPGPFSDVDASVKFKPMSGREDASGGLVVRRIEQGREPRLSLPRSADQRHEHGGDAWRRDDVRRWGRRARRDMPPGLRRDRREDRVRRWCRRCVGGEAGCEPHRRHERDRAGGGARARREVRGRARPPPRGPPRRPSAQRHHGHSRSADGES